MGLLVVGILYIALHMFPLIRDGFIFEIFSCFTNLMWFDIVLWFLRDSACLVKWFPQFHIASLIIEFVAHSMELAFLIGSISWSVTEGPLLITLALALLLFTNLLPSTGSQPSRYVLLKGSAEQKVALAKQACPSDALSLPKEDFDIVLVSVDCI